MGGDIYHIIPLLFLIISGLFLMILDAFKVRSILPLIAALGFVGTIVLTMLGEGGLFGAETAVFKLRDGTGGMLMVGGIYNVITVFLCLSGAFTLFFLGDFMKRKNIDIPDVYSLLVFAVAGMIMLANSNDLIITFIGLETMSICLYVMAALFKREAGSNESGLKYFLLGAFATGFFIYGAALIYGTGGSTNYTLLGEFMRDADWAKNPMLYPGVGLMLIGFLFKVSAFPFHAWTPDVYNGTPTPLAGFMATGSKMAAFIAVGVFLSKLGLLLNPQVLGVVAIASILTMVYGNIVAIQQKNIKRMLAYSSIAHSGYVLLGLCAGKEGFDAAIFYMLIYTVMNIGAFGLVGMAEQQDVDTEMESWKGLGLKNPWFGSAMTIFLFSLAGVPPLAGFMGKYFVFGAAIQDGFIWLAVIGILSSVLGAFYYIRLIWFMFFRENETPVAVATKRVLPFVGVGVMALLVVLLGVYPSLVLDLIN